MIGAATPDACRVLIVGAGMAGLETARELERLGMRDVLVVEAGPSRELRHVNVVHPPADALRVWLERGADESFRCTWSSHTPPHYTGSSGLRQRLGGRSLYWYGVTLPIESWALAEPWWPRAVIEDLSLEWNGGASLYARVQCDLASWRRSAGEPQDEELRFAGFRWRPTPRAIRRSAAGADRWYAYSPLDAWRDPETGTTLREPDGVRFCTGLQVLDVVRSRSHATGVLVRDAGSGDVREIRANAVVLAGGTLENSRLAMQALSHARDLPTVTLHGLVDHIVQGVFVRLGAPQARRLWSGLKPGSYIAPCTGARSNLFLDLQVLPGGEAFVDLQLTGEQMPSAGSYVSCERSDDLPWPVTVTTVTSPDDRAVIDAQQTILAHVWGALAAVVGSKARALTFADYNRPERTNSCVLAPMEVDAPVTWSSCLGTEDHEGGTLPLGTVLGTEQQFAEIGGLYAAGPSTFPRSGAANPGLTILALSRRLAAILMARA